jgi:hypothetical protein
MTPINNSDTAWLIVADWNQDNDMHHEELKEDVLEPVVNSWHYEYRVYAVGGDSYHVGYNVPIGGNDIYIGFAARVGGTNNGNLVGGHDSN